MQLPLRREADVGRHIGLIASGYPLVRESAGVHEIVQVSSIKTFLIERPPERGLRRADEGRGVERNKREFTNRTLVREEDVTALTNSFPDSCSRAVSYALRRIKKHSSGIHVCCPNERTLSLAELVSARTVLTVVAVCHEQDPLVLELED